jgi:hypothetical protein
MHQTPHLFCSRCEAFLTEAYNGISSLGCSEVMAYRTNSTQPLDKYRGFPVGPSLYEPLKAPEFNNMKAALGDLPIVVNMYGYFPVAFNPRYGIYSDFLSHCVRINQIL